MLEGQHEAITELRRRAVATHGLLSIGATKEDHHAAAHSPSNDAPSSEAAQQLSKEAKIIAVHAPSANLTTMLYQDELKHMVQMLFPDPNHLAHL